MEYVIGGLVLIFVAFIIGIVVRKKHYNEIDRFADKKIEIMNMPLADELARVKSLNMTGQTERMFERWRSEWDHIQTVQLSDVEELLFDAEEYADKFRLKKSVEARQAIVHIFDEIEMKIDTIIQELNDLVGSEEKSKLLVNELLLSYRDAKKHLLAHQHSFGEAALKLEQEFEEISGDFQMFNEQTDAGNYLEAREQVFGIEARLQNLIMIMEKIPDLNVACQTQIPGQIDDLKSGYVEMSKQGYPLSHLYFEKEIGTMEKELVHYRELIKNTEVEEAQKGLSDLNEKIQSMYDILEKEVTARQYVLSVKNIYQQKLAQSTEKHIEIEKETNLVQQIYQLPEKEVEVRSNLEKTLSSLKSKWELFKNKLSEEQTAYSILKDEIVDLESKLNKLEQQQMDYEEKLNTLRKGELESRETIKQLQKTMAESIRMMHLSNIPGLPTSYELMVVQARESIADVKTKLNEKPLNMHAVMQYLDIASVAVNKVKEATIEMTEQVMLTEQVIQYGNRYRSKFPSLAAALGDAEKKFRNYQYEDALEQAATAVEQVEPGALKKIQSYLDGNA